MNNLDKLVTLIPLHELEQEAQQQIYSELQHDFLCKMAIMPDAHPGYHLVIGGVALLDGVISPSYIGYDEGCGMCLIITDMDINHIMNKRIKIMEKIYNSIPVGFNSHPSSRHYLEFKTASKNKELQKKVSDKLFVQLGTLGGGNHFIEIGKNKDNRVSITIHSGSRNIGHSIAQYYIDLSKKVDNHLPNGFLSLHSEFGQMFIQDFEFALQFALDNRKEMMKNVLNILGLPENLLSRMVNENHNHASILEDNKVLHRKGATPAEKDQIGVIPGNMRDGVFVTVGLGNQHFLNSSSHGAGRVMSRTKAKEHIDIKEVEKQMKEHDIVAKINDHMTDEAPAAYKKIEDVIKQQEGIVINVIDFIKPVLNIKGADPPKRKEKRK